MPFQLRPILSEIKSLYLQPRSTNRFKEYLSKLQGDSKGDLVLPIMGFNPMAKGHLLQKIEELESLEAERIMKEAIEEVNANSKDRNAITIEVVLNIADDLKGAWTNFYTTDFDSKFKIAALIKRNFCTPYFWTSESYSKELIRLRTKEYLNRTIFGLNNSKPTRLEEYVKQEIFVSKNTVATNTIIEDPQFNQIDTYYLANKESEEYDLIFNFFYGDSASESLGYKKYGIKGKTGFEYAQFLYTEKNAL